MEFFINRVIEDEQVREILRNNPELSSKGKAIAREIIETGTAKEKEEGLLALFVMGHLCAHTLEVNGKRGIPEEYTVATLKDVNIWIENYKQRYDGQIGVSVFWAWLIYHCKGELFRLGRLQYILTSSEKTPDKGRVLDVHIPQGEPLREEACLESFAMAKDFYATYFPEVEVHYAQCCSWLLNPNLAYILGDDANIVKFMRLWTLKTIYFDNSAAAVERVFGLGTCREQLPDLPETTSLQRKMKDFLLKGGDVSNCYGYREI